MSRASDNNGRKKSAEPRLTPTVLDQVNPFDSTTQRAIAPETQTTSDPPTTLVRQDGFRELPAGSVVGENYEIDARLGAGAMGEVYAARHVRLGKRVAIKVIGRRLSEDAAAIERFAMEARTLAQIQHPAIVAVEHVGELPDGRAWFVMEFLKGETLFERLARGRVPLQEALRILDQMARGLDAAHAQGVIHRDLKPENTFLVQLPGERPIVKLVDFGLSKIMAGHADQRAERTQSGVAIGTPMYMSPEQARGPDVDHRTDIYALGAVAYELVLGARPFPHARTAPEIFAAHLHESPPLPRSIWPEIPPQLDLVLFAMIAKDPNHRPTLAQVRAVIAAVRSSASQASQRAKTEFVEPRLPRVRSRRLALGAIVIAALVGGVVIGVSISQQGQGAASSSPPPVATPESEFVPNPPPPHAEDPAPVEDAKRAEAPRARDAGSGDRHAPQAQRPVPIVTPIVTAPASPAPSDLPVDASVDAKADAEEPPTPPPTPISPERPIARPKIQPHPIDRNQTMNPFNHKVNP